MSPTCVLKVLAGCSWNELAPVVEKTVVNDVNEAQPLTQQDITRRVLDRRSA